MLKKIAVADLRLGMFIHEFCGSWMEHPFWKAKFVLETQKDLQRVRDSAVSEVWIDTSKGLDVEAGQASQSEEEVAAETEARLLAAAVEPVKPPRANLDEEVERALKLCSRSREAVSGPRRTSRYRTRLSRVGVPDHLDRRERIRV